MLADEAEDVFCLFGMEPCDVFVAFEPRHLFAGVDACVLLYFF